ADTARRAASQATKYPAPHSTPRTWCTRCSWQDRQRTIVPLANPNGSEVRTIGRQDSVNATALRDCGDGSVDESQRKSGKFQIELHGTHQVRGRSGNQLVSALWIKDIGEQLPHRAPSSAEEI